MRTYHRWLALFFAPFLLWIACTGFLIQVVPLVYPAANRPPALTAADVPAGFLCPPSMTCRPKRKAIGGVLHGLHSGERFGPLGTALSILSSLALLFFSFSGLWMYVQMWRNRARRSLKPRWFW